MASSNGGYVTIAIYKDGDAPGANSAQMEHRVWHNTATNASKLSAATIQFPDAHTTSGSAVFPLPEGKYYACVRHGSTNVLSRAEFTVVKDKKPEITLSKTEFISGEDITVTYENVEKSLLNGKSWVTIAIFKKGDVVGQNASIAEHRVWHVDASKNPSELSAATITFPAADGGREGANFPLPEGEYYICVRQDNAAVSEIVTFTVKTTENNASTGDTDLFLACSMVALCIGAVVVFKKRRSFEE